MTVKRSEPITIFAFGDLQFGAVDSFDHKLWARFKERATNTPNAYYIGLGDYGDWLRPTMRAELNRAMEKDSSAREQMEVMIHRQYAETLDEMKFMKGRCLALHDGHHNWTFQDGTTATQWLCGKLLAPYAGWMAYTQLRLRRSGSREIKSLTILSMHGEGSARMVTTDAGWMERNIYPAWDADIYLRGHSTKLLAYKDSRCYAVERGQGVYVQRMKHLANCGGFSTGYTQGGQTSYVERTGLKPSPGGWVEIRLKIRTANAAEARAKRIGASNAASELNVEVVTMPGAE